MRFQFAVISEQDIQNSRGGDDMLEAINYDGTRDQVVTGRPGSGKTTVTIMRARRLAALKKVVLVLTKHKLLVYSLVNSYPQSKHPGLNIMGIHRWFWDKFKEQLSSYHSSEALREKFNSLGYKYAEVLIDEGQDLPAFVYEALPAMGHQILVGADTAQRIDPRGAEATEISQALTGQGRQVKPVALQYNYRNFVETYDFARQFVPEFDAAQSSLILENTTKGQGGTDYLPRVIQVANKYNELVNIIQDNITSNIVVLVAHVRDVSLYHSILTARGIQCSLYHNDLTPTETFDVTTNMQNVLVTTYVSVKGLEFQVVIMPDMQYALPTATYPSSIHYYVSCTRATERLYLLYQGTVRPPYIRNFRESSYQHIGLNTATTLPPVPSVPQLPADDILPF